jgi:alpha-tubulin suppressor-like RCC1 family protein
VTAGGQHSVAVLDDGRVLAWGNTLYGALGNGSSTTVESAVSSPVQVSGLGPGSAVVAVSSTGAHTLAVKSDGTVLGWGWNRDGQLGDGTTTDRAVPVAVSGLTDVVAVAAGEEFSLALKSDGSVWAWGSNRLQQLGYPASVSSSSTPVAVPGLGAGSGIVQIAAGLTHGIARTGDGRVYSWGPDTYSAATAPALARTAPHLVAGFTGEIVDIDAGNLFDLAAMSDGSMVAWGDGSYGRRCDGGGVWHDGPAPTDFGPGTGVVDVEAGYQSALVRLADGRVFGCGYDANNVAGS